MTFYLGHEIIPKELMTDEINYQIDCWKSDSYGRRDFSHLLNVEFRKWEIKKKNDLKLLRQQQILKGTFLNLMIYHIMIIKQLCFEEYVT